MRHKPVGAEQIRKAMHVRDIATRPAPARPGRRHQVKLHARTSQPGVQRVTADPPFALAKLQALDIVQVEVGRPVPALIFQPAPRGLIVG